MFFIINVNIFLCFYCSILKMEFSSEQYCGNRNCDTIKTGTFHLKSSSGKNRYKIIRDEHTQMEINLSKGDTSFWKISWIEDCMFSLKFIRKTGSITKKEFDIYSNHLMVVQIIEVAHDYYIYKGGIDQISNKSIRDTVIIDR